MPEHRSRRPGRGWQRFVRNRVEIVGAEVRAPLRDSEVIASWSAMFYLAPGHPWQGIRCLICAQAAGDQALYCAIVAGAAVHAESYYRCGTAGYLIHAEHGKLAPLELWLAAHRLESPGCGCHSRSAGAELTYPYHQL